MPHTQLPVQIDDVEPLPRCGSTRSPIRLPYKVAAMYELHNGRPSGRFRDLAGPGPV